MMKVGSSPSVIQWQLGDKAGHFLSQNYEQGLHFSLQFLLKIQLPIRFRRDETYMACLCVYATAYLHVVCTR